MGCITMLVLAYVMLALLSNPTPDNASAAGTVILILLVLRILGGPAES